jgi:ribosomal-protein-alanine N-acetyltransferase
MTETLATGLRSLSLPDAAVQRIYSPRAVRFLPRAAMTERQQAEEWLVHSLACQQEVPWQRMTWGVTNGPDLLGIIRLDRQIPSGSEGKQAALSYILREESWGKGHETRAVRAVINRAFTSLGLIVIRARHHPANAASGKVLTNAGFTKIGTSDEAITYVLERTDP